METEDSELAGLPLHSANLDACALPRSVEVVSPSKESLLVSPEQGSATPSCLCKIKDWVVGSKKNPDVSFGFSFHGFARAPFYIGMLAYMQPHLSEAAELEADIDGKVTLIGIPLWPSSYFATITVLALLFNSITSVLLGTLTDFTSHRKSLLVLFSTTGALAGVLFLALYWPSMWRTGSLLYFIIFNCYEYVLLLIYAYLPEISENEQERYKASAHAIAWGNGGQAGWVIVISLLLFFALPTALEVDNGSFEDPLTGDDWVLGLDGLDQACPVSGCQRSSAFAESGSYSLNLNFSSPVNASVAQVVGSSDSAYNGLEALLRFEVRATGPVKVAAGLQEGPSFTHMEQTLQESSGWKHFRVRTSLQGEAALQAMVKCECVSTSECNVWVDSVSALSTKGIWRVLAISMLGLWWGVVSFGSLRHLPIRPPSRSLPPGQTLLKATYSEVKKTLRITQDPENKQVVRFLVVSMLYAMGGAAFMSVIGTYIEKELDYTPALTGVVLLTAQLFGIAGAYVSLQMGDRIGLNNVFVGVNFLLAGIVGSAGYIVPEVPHLIWISAALAGIAIGSGIATVRTFMSGLTKPGQEAEYMGLFMFSIKILSWLGPLAFVVMNEIFNSMRAAMASLAVFFLAAGLLMMRVDPVSPRPVPVQRKDSIQLQEIKGIEEEEEENGKEEEEEEGREEGDAAAEAEEEEKSSSQID